MNLKLTFPSFRNLIVIIFFFCFTSPLFAQYAEQMRAIRPGFATGAFTVGQSVFQVQSGLNFTQRENNDVRLSDTWQHKTVLRYGIFEKFEVSGVISYRRDKTFLSVGDDNVAGVDNTQLGVRYNIFDGTGSFPGLAIQARTLLRLQSENYQRAKTGLNITLAGGKKVAPWMILNASAGSTWLGNEGDPIFPYALRLTPLFTPIFGATVEMYGTLNDFDSNFNIGLFYFVNNDLKIDIFTNPFDRNLFLVELGVSFRFHNREDSN